MIDEEGVRRAVDLINSGSIPSKKIKKVLKMLNFFFWGGGVPRSARTALEASFPTFLRNPSEKGNFGSKFYDKISQKFSFKILSPQKKFAWTILFQEFFQMDFRSEKGLKISNFGSKFFSTKFQVKNF